MAGIGGINNSYSSYTPMYGKTANNDASKTDGENKEAKGTKSTTSATSANGTNSVDDYLKQLREKFSNYNITVGAFEANYAGKNGLHNIVLSPEILKKMANDPKIAAEMEEKINLSMTQGLATVKGMAAMRGNEIHTHVIGFDENGLANTAIGSQTAGMGARGLNSLGSSGTNRTRSMFDKMRDSNIENEKRATERREAKRAEERKAKKELEEQRLEEARQKRTEEAKAKYDTSSTFDFRDYNEVDRKI